MAKGDTKQPTKPHIARGRHLPPKPSADAAHWEIFRVTPSGGLIPDYSPDFSKTTDFACIRGDGTHLLTAMLYRLPKPEKESTIKVAFSANLWNANLRKQNLGNGVMTAIDVKQLLAGDNAAPGMGADPEWMNRHIAEFVLPKFQHGNLAPTYPFSPQIKGGTALAERMALLDGKDPTTKGKSRVIILEDAPGVATDLSDISRARYEIGLAYVKKNEHPLGAAARIKGLEQQSRRLQEVQQAIKPVKRMNMSQVLRQDAKGIVFALDGSLLDTTHGRSGEKQTQAIPLPPQSEWPKWEFIRRDTFEAYVIQVLQKTLPASTCYFPRQGAGPTDGFVFAPAADMEQLRVDEGTQMAMSKVNRLHNGGALQSFVNKFDGDMKKHQDAVDEHDADRKLVLVHQALERCFHKHYDPNETSESSCVTYLEESGNVLISWGGVSTSMHEAVEQFLNAKVDSLQGWALRSLAANNSGIYSLLTNLLEHGADWTTNEDAKLDKSYDSLKFALFSEKTGGLLEAKVPWLKPSSVALSFHIMAFMGAAATQAVATALDKEFPGFAKTPKDAADRASKLIDKVSGNVANKAVQTQLARASKIQAWCHHQALLLEGFLNKKPPARPVYARVTLTIEQAIEVLMDRRALGDKFNKATRKTLAEWRKLPDNIRSKTVELDFLTTDEMLKEAQKTEKVASDAERVKVVTRQASKPVVMVTTASLGEMYRTAHRFDGMKKALVDLMEKTMPKWGSLLSEVAGAPRKMAYGLARGSVTWQGQFSIWGAYLQWRGLQKNSAKIDALKGELDKIPNLTPEQRAAINDEIFLTRMAVTDNISGVFGGVMELGGIGTKLMGFKGTTAIFEGFAAFGGSAGAAANAAQNWNKAEGKAKEGDVIFRNLYFMVFITYTLASASLFLNGVAILAEWIIKRLSLRLGMSLTMAIAIGCEWLPYVGWGITIIAFLVEGLVNWYDRTKMEAWVEFCYFGKKKKYAGLSEEEAAFDEAMNEMVEQALRAAKDLPEGAQ